MTSLKKNVAGEVRSIYMEIIAGEHSCYILLTFGQMVADSFILILLSPFRLAAFASKKVVAEHAGDFAR